MYQFNKYFLTYYAAHITILWGIGLLAVFGSLGVRAISLC